MNSTSSDYRHPKHDAMVRLLRDDLTDTAIAKQLRVDRRAVARVRGLLGMKPKTNATTLFHKLDQHTTEADAEGHVRWTGRTTRNGTPETRHLGKSVPAAHVAFERRTGRKPVGTCRADCGVKHCVADTHVQDDLERRTVRMQERALYGLEPKPWDECPEGHGWDAHGRVEPDLTPYCKQCNTERAARSRAARIATANED